jgi:hypothetical protein
LPEAENPRGGSSGLGDGHVREICAEPR